MCRYRIQDLGYNHQSCIIMVLETIRTFKRHRL